MNPITGVAAAAAAAVSLVTLAACGSTATTDASGTASSGAAATGAATPSGSGLHVGHTSLGEVLVDGSGHTVYLLTADHHGTSTCDAGCAAAWPPVPPAGGTPSGVTGTLGRTTTPAGTAVATLNGVPLYTYTGDPAPGDVNGQDIHSFGGQWYAVSPSGTKVENDGSSDSGGGYGY